MSEPDEIVERITAAFAEVPQPARDALINRHCCECLETSEAYGGKPWPEITLEELLRGREVALLTATAWRYYLPAFLIWSIRAPEAVDVFLDNLVSQLEPPSETRGVAEWFAERAVGFSPDQRQAIVAFLNWYRVRDEAMWRNLGGEPPGGVYDAIRYWTAS
jgi:hypothetical protein